MDLLKGLSYTSMRGCSLSEEMIFYQHHSWEKKILQSHNRQGINSDRAHKPKQKLQQHFQRQGLMKLSNCDFKTAVLMHLQYTSFRDGTDRMFLR